MGSNNVSNGASSRKGQFSPAKELPVPRSVLKLMTALRQGRFTERQRESLAQDELFGPMYKAMMISCEPQMLMFLQTKKPDLYFKYIACTAHLVCTEEFSKWVKCRQSCGDPNLCNDFREEVERCGARTSQLMLRAALADEWY